MDVTTMAETIQDFIYDLRAEQRLYPDHYAADLAKAIVAAQGDDTFEPHARADAPATSKAVFDKIKRSSFQEQMLYHYTAPRIDMIGYTDDEMEQITGRTHQSVSACRNALVHKGYLVDSGQRRPTRSGNQANVYVWTRKTWKS